MDKDLLRFYSYIIDYSIDDLCWEWKKPLMSGYGRFGSGGKFHLAHRWIYEYYIGPIPEDYVIDHKCSNRACVNLRHLEAVTKAENNRRITISHNLNTKCRKGHVRTTDNTYINPSTGRRQCYTCVQISNQTRYLNKL